MCGSPFDFNAEDHGIRGGRSLTHLKIYKRLQTYCLVTFKVWGFLTKKKKKKIYI